MAVEAKICGLTRPEDAALAVRLGAAYLGVVFAGGPRVVTRVQAREVVCAAGRVPVLGVFAGQSLDEILEVCRETGLRGVQLHGGYDAPAADALRREGLVVWRVARLAGRFGPGALAAFAAGADAVLVEPRVEDRLGGAGVPLPLELAARARQELADHRMVLAGGLTPESVSRAMTLVQPDLVDVSSGVELAPGIKDPDRLARFLEAVVGHHAPT
ncbi:MAG: phosphoribosylanthranilate isomerase [Gemmatimonadota bacterium]